MFDPKLARTALAEEPEHPGATFHEGGQEIRRWEAVTRDPSRQVMTVWFRFEAAASELCGVGEVQMRSVFDLPRDKMVELRQYPAWA